VPSSTLTSSIKTKSSEVPWNEPEEKECHFSKSGISIPDTTAQRLCKRFLKYFTAVHQESPPQIEEKIDQKGGYVLQIDGTQNHGRGTITVLSRIFVLLGGMVED